MLNESCSDRHLGFPINKQNFNFARDHPMIIHVQFGFSPISSFCEKKNVLHFPKWFYDSMLKLSCNGSQIEIPD
jgi:hypothetical protein